MTRGLLDAIGLFALPFLVYGALLIVRQRYPFMAASWTVGRLAALTAIGLALVVGGMLLLAAFAPRHQGAWVPDHVENGRLVPGHIE